MWRAGGEIRWARHSNNAIMCGEGLRDYVDPDVAPLKEDMGVMKFVGGHLKTRLPTGVNGNSLCVPLS
jgi:hypothetical protein